jgi:hypothetical protein
MSFKHWRALESHKGNGYDFTFLTISQLPDYLNAAISTMALPIFKISG